VFGNERRYFVQVTCVERVEIAGDVLNTGGKEYAGEGRKKGYIYSNSCDLIHIVIATVIGYQAAVRV
jgi:hypothetical protein